MTAVGVFENHLRGVLNSNPPVGVNEIETCALEQELETHRYNLYVGELESLILNNEEKIELLARAVVRSKFMAVLKGKLERPLLEALKSVFFEIVYLTLAQT